MRVANALASSYKPIFGPASGQIEHQAGGPTATIRVPAIVRDFVAEVRVFNPLGHKNGEWDYGFFFRQRGPDDHFQLFIDHSWKWRLMLSRGEGFSEGRPGQYLIVGGMFPDIDVAPNGFNDLRLIAQGEDGFFFVNGKYVSYLRLHDWMREGDVVLGTGFVSGRQVPGGTTRYENFVVSSSR